MTSTVIQKIATETDRPPVNDTDTAIHYGYVVYKEIALNDSTGKLYYVQPSDSPFYNVLPCRQLIPFTNISYGEIDEQAAHATLPGAGKLPVRRKQKTALECAVEMEQAYEAWSFVILRSATGVKYDDVFQIFQTIQPFAYKLKHILEELEFPAIERIDRNEDYEVSYGGETIALQPLPTHLKPLAEKIRAQMVLSAEIGVELGTKIKDNTTQKMNSFFASGRGKDVADPLDKYIFNEFEETIPRLLDKENQVVTTTESPEMIELKKEEMELKRRDLELRERELAMKEVRLVPAVPSINAEVQPTCRALTVKGVPCQSTKLNAEGVCAFHADKSE